MPAENAPFGAQAYKHRTRAATPVDRTIASGETNSIGIGDPVVETGTGGGIRLAGASGKFLGFFAGCTYVTSSGERKQGMWVGGTTLETGTTAEALVITDPDQIMAMQASGSTSADIVGANVDMVIGTPDAKSGKSRSTANIANADATARQLRVEGLVDEPGNSWDDAYPILAVRGNNMDANSTTGTA